MTLNKIMRKIITKDPKRIIGYAFIFALIGYLACPLSIQLDPVDWWDAWDMIWYSDDYQTEQYKLHADLSENVYLAEQGGLRAFGPGQLFGRLIYTFETSYLIEKGRLGVKAESASQTCAIDVYIDGKQAGSFNGSKEMLFCTSDNLPSDDDPRQWVIISNPNTVQVKLIFYSLSADGPKDLRLEQLEFSARVHGLPDDDEPIPKFGNVGGHIINDVTHAPVSGAKVEMENQTDTTDSSGYFQFDHIECASYLIFVNASGYEECVSGIAVKECVGSNVCNTIDISIVPAGVSTSTASIEGYVTHSETGNPISGATVSLHPRGYPDDLVIAKTNSDGYYKMVYQPTEGCWLLCLAKNCAPHTYYDIKLQGEMRYDIQMGPGVSYPIPPGRGYNPESETGYSYHPPAPPEYNDDSGTYNSTYPVYVPPTISKAPTNYPAQGPKYQNPVQSAPVDGADYVPPPPAYRNSGGLQGSGVTTPPQNPLDQAIKGWQHLYNRAQLWIREVFQ